MARHKEIFGDFIRPKKLAVKFDVSPKTIYSWIKQGKLRAYKIGNSVRITNEDLQIFIKLNCEPMKAL